MDFEQAVRELQLGVGIEFKKKTTILNSIPTPIYLSLLAYFIKPDYHIWAK